jgi:hypothetical protein
MLLKPKWDKILRVPLNKCPSGNIYRKLNLATLGLDLHHFNPLRLSYNNLHIDPYYPINNNYPVRFRKYSRFLVDISNSNEFLFSQQYVNHFSQNVDGSRGNTRLFIPMEDTVIDKYFYQLMTQIVGLIVNDNPLIKNLDISAHQVRTISYPDTVSDNAPEGIHQDGADYVVSALVFNRHNISHGKSHIYDNHKQSLYTTSLQTGEFILQDDRQLWHDITPIENCGNHLGYRYIMGFDFNITG